MKDSAFENFGEGVMDAVYDFARCQRPDGSFYGTSGQCRKGASTGAKEQDAPKGKSSGGEASKDAPAKSGAPTAKEVKALDKTAKAADKKAEAADKAWRKAGMPKGDQQKEVRRLDKEAKAANKEADKADKAFQKANKTPKRDDSKDLKRGNTVIGTSPRNMLIDNIKTMEGRLKDSRSEGETKLLKDSIAKAKAKLAKEDKAAKPAAKPKASPEEKAAKQLKSAKSKLRMEAKGLKEMRDLGITDSRISAAASRVRNAKNKVEELRNKAAKKSGKARPEKSSMTSRIAKEERDIRRQAGAGSAKAKQYTDLKKRIQEGRVQDPISARRQLSSLRSELKPASSNQ